jgi:DNA-binding PadR family transcriptional regulator
MKELSNVEFVLLQLLSEKKELSGYEINHLIIERGYREWSDIGTTSIYIGLKKLQKRKLVDSFIDIKKEGKGPLPKKFNLTKEGVVRLEQEIIKALSFTRESDQRFDIGIASIPVLKKENVTKALMNRKNFLKEQIKRINEKYFSQGGERLPFHIKALFIHPQMLTKSELKFIDYLIDEINKT